MEPTGQPEKVQRLLSDPATPRWLKELDRFLPIKSHFVLHGNIRDRHPFALGGGQYDMCSTQELLVDFLALRGFEYFFTVNPVQGVTVLMPSDQERKKYGERTNAWVQKTGLDKLVQFEPDAKGNLWRAAASFPLAVEFAEAAAHNKDARCAIFFGYLMGQTEQGQSKHTDSFVRSLIFSYEAKPAGAYYNTVIWLCDRENDLPAWFTLNNPRIRSVALAKPDSRMRTLAGEFLLTNLPDFAKFDADQKRKTVDEFSLHTDGLLMSDLEAIVRFMPPQQLEATEVAEAARRYKLGVTEDPWRRIDKNKIHEAEQLIRKRVKGQEPAIVKSLDIIRRAIVGLAGAQAARTSGKPKGVLFFAGPTGVGKTELAKSITEALFGDETAYIRFDMSEFNHEHSDQRLIGAPPGYVGFDAGGELTSAIRERPFSVVLFDEIEKAHGRILDKFLQILDDGQLTSGKGERVYFSDAVIVFTSNLGMGAAEPGDDYSTLAHKVRQGVTSYFKEKLNRPELLNRIGDNIVVFDFIRPEVAIEILSKMTGNILERLRETQQIYLTLSGFPPGRAPAADSAFSFLADRCTSDLTNGGRGIGNMLESYLINPLSRAIWEANLRAGDAARIERIRMDGATPVVELSR